MNGKLAGNSALSISTLKKMNLRQAGVVRSPSIGGVWGGRYRISATVPFKNIDLPK